MKMKADDNKPMVFHAKPLFHEKITISVKFHFLTYISLFSLKNSINWNSFAKYNDYQKFWSRTQFCYFFPSNQLSVAKLCQIFTLWKSFFWENLILSFLFIKKFAAQNRPFALCSNNFQNVKLSSTTKVYLPLNFAWNQFWHNLNIKNCHIYIFRDSELWCYIWD